jgi:hypothetical protein
LIEKLHILWGDRLREAFEHLGRIQLIAFEFVHRLFHGDPDEKRRELVQHLSVVGRELFERLRASEELGHVHRTQQLRNPHDVIARNRAKHGARFFLAGLPAPEGDQLVQQRQPVPHASIRRLRNEPQAGRFELNPLLLEDLPHALGNLRNRQPLQVELQTPGQHGHRQLLRIRRSEEEFHMRRRFLERLQ